MDSSLKRKAEEILDATPPPPVRDEVVAELEATVLKLIQRVSYEKARSDRARKELDLKVAEHNIKMGERAERIDVLEKRWRELRDHTQELFKELSKREAKITTLEEDWLKREVKITMMEEEWRVLGLCEGWSDAND